MGNKTLIITIVRKKQLFRLMLYKRLGDMQVMFFPFDALFLVVVLIFTVLMDFFSIGQGVYLRTRKE